MKKDSKERAHGPLALSFYVSLLPLGTHAGDLMLGVYFVPEVLTLVLGRSFVLFSWAFPFLTLSFALAVSGLLLYSIT